MARAPAEDGTQDTLPEIAFIQDDQIVAEPWNGKL
jgi:hypothetical protein